MYGANPYPHRTVAKPVKLGTRPSWIVGLAVIVDKQQKNRPQGGAITVATQENPNRTYC